MVAESEPLVDLLTLVVGIRLPDVQPRRGRPEVYAAHLFLKALVVMLVRRVWTAHGLLAILAEPTPQVAPVRAWRSGGSGKRAAGLRYWSTLPAGAPGTW